MTTPVAAPDLEVPGESVRVLRVDTRRHVAADVVALELVPVDGHPLPAWSPGAHLELELEPSSGPTLVRHYSLCGDPDDRGRYQVAVLAAEQGRGGSAYVHEWLHPGSAITVRGPRNHFPLEPASEYLFLAGGIGITPILAMAREADRKQVPWRAVYLGRSADRMAFRDELVELGRQRGSSSREVIIWSDAECGQFDLDALVQGIGAETQVYACGPEGLLVALENLHQESNAWGLHLERFAAAPADTSEDQPFEVVLASTGATHTVPVGSSILSVLREQGVEVESSCSEGVCGTCETRLLRGSPDHRDAVLSPEERAAGDYLMICVSRALTSQLVLDL